MTITPKAYVDKCRQLDEAIQLMSELMGMQYIDYESCVYQDIKMWLYKNQLNTNTYFSQP